MGGEREREITSHRAVSGKWIQKKRMGKCSKAGCIEFTEMTHKSNVICRE